MMQQKFSNAFVFLLTVVCPYLLPAQDTVVKVSKPVFGHTSFYYDFPKSFGASAGIDFPLRSKLKISIDKNGKEKIRHRDLILMLILVFTGNGLVIQVFFLFLQLANGFTNRGLIILNCLLAPVLYALFMTASFTQ